MSNSAPRTRFAPSPTGYLHVGGARTAIFNWLFARKHGGSFILRIEDTDAKRNTQEACEAIFEGLRWLGIAWDEGPDAGGAFGPYFQSQRNAIYEKHLGVLEAKGLIYEDEGALRFRSPRKTVVVEDIICGRIPFDMSNPLTHPDMTLRRPDGSWIFHFVNVVDDLEMGITHVIRGEDHLSNTPKHIELYQALGAEPPKFAHVPLILNHEGKKLSKRDGGASIGAYIEEGYAPEAVFNYLCLLGWSPKDNREVLTREEILEAFTLEGINRRNAIFDLDKCFWIQGQHIQRMSLERFAELAAPVLRKAGIDFGDTNRLLAALPLAKEKIKLLKDVPEWLRCCFTEDFPIEQEALDATLKKPGAKQRLEAAAQAVRQAAPWNADAIEAQFKAAATAAGWKTAELVHPVRVAVSGRKVGPSLYHLLEFLGRDRVLARIDRALPLSAE